MADNQGGGSLGDVLRLLGAVGDPVAEAAAGAAAPVPAAVPGALGVVPAELQIGTVKAWIEERGMGFITPATGGDDVFVHRSSLVDGHSLAKGSIVTYEPGWDEKKGKPIAKMCSGASPKVDGVSPGLMGGSAGAIEVALPLSDGNAMGSPMLSGLVKVWLEEKGYGFVTPSDNSGDVFVHRSALQDGKMLVQGAMVTFDTQFDAARGKRIATKCFGAAGGSEGGAWSSDSPSSANLKSGTVKAWFEDKGFGFIANSDGSGDAFVHRSAVAEGLMLQAGMTVQFEGHWNAMRQKETATRVMAASGGFGMVNGGGAGWAGDGGWAGEQIVALPAATGQVVPPPPGAPGGERQPSNRLRISGLPSGVSAEVIEAIFAPYGTIASLEILPANGNADATASINFSDLEQAKWIRENLDQNMPVGLVSPLTIRYDDAASVGAYGKATAGGGDVRFSPYAGGGTDFEHVSPSAPIAGIVKAWMEDRGMGFVTPASGGPDVFVHRSDLVGAQALVVGTSVSYESSWDAQKQKAIAKNVTVGMPIVATGLPPQPDPQASWALPVPGGSDWKMGTVKAWIEERGMGFISPGDGSADVFVHRSNLVDGQMLLVGMPVSFEPGWDAVKGKPVANACSGAIPRPEAGPAGPSGFPGGAGVPIIRLAGAA